jgi:hypothetical protein
MVVSRSVFSSVFTVYFNIAFSGTMAMANPRSTAAACIFDYSSGQHTTRLRVGLVLKKIIAMQTTNPKAQMLMPE